ncbi:MAG: hypothetical protein WCJ62_12065 [Flavobacterium sp.]
MPLKTYNKTNFHNHTFCIFQEVSLDEIQELSLNYKSKSGSCYYFTSTGVYRLSNHWGRAANCKWRLVNNNNNVNSNISNKGNKNNNRTKLGFAHWRDFYSDNDYEKLYFIDVDYDTKTVQFYHKLSQEFSSGKVLRTASETTKLIKQIRTLFDETAWVKYLKNEDIKVLRKEIIAELVNTNNPFQQIRKKYL